MVEFLTATISAPVERDEHGKDVTTSEQYQEKTKGIPNLVQMGSVCMVHTIVMYA